MTMTLSQSAALPARDSYRRIELYAPNRAPCRIDLSDNTNRHGIPPMLAELLKNTGSNAITRYPSLYAESLKEKLGCYLNVPASCISTGCGSDDVLDSAMRALASPGDSIAYSVPTFPMIPVFAHMNGLNPVAVPCRDDFTIDVDALLDTGARIIYVCSPNNPTGAVAASADLARLVSEAPGVVIIDEAYADYAGDSLIARGVRSDRVFVTRTFSKAFALAGLRVGYGVGAPSLATEVEKSRGPYKVNALAERAAIAMVTDGLGWVRARVAEDIAVRDRLADALRALGLDPIPSRANFVLVPVQDALTLSGTMRDLGVAVRPFTGLEGIGDALRISAGPWPMIEECLGALESAMRTVE